MSPAHNQQEGSACNVAAHAELQRDNEVLRALVDKQAAEITAIKVKLAALPGAAADTVAALPESPTKRLRKLVARRRMSALRSLRARMGELYNSFTRYNRKAYAAVVTSPKQKATTKKAAPAGQRVVPSA